MYNFSETMFGKRMGYKIAMITITTTIHATENLYQVTFLLYDIVKTQEQSFNLPVCTWNLQSGTGKEGCSDKMRGI